MNKRIKKKHRAKWARQVHAIPRLQRDPGNHLMANPLELWMGDKSQWSSGPPPDEQDE